MTRLRQDANAGTLQTFDDDNAWSVAGLWNRANQRLSLTASGAASFTSDGRSTRLGLGSLSFWGSPEHAFRYEIGATGTALGTSDAKPATSWTAFVREHLIGAGRGMWVGGGRGELNAETLGRAANLAEAGVWAGREERLVSASVATTWTSTTVVGFPTLSPGLTSGTSAGSSTHVPIAFGDATVAGRWTSGDFDFDAAGGYRFRLRGSADLPKVSGTLGITWWWTPNIALATAIGRQLTDAIRGTAQTRFATLAVRFSAEPRGRTRTTVSPAIESAAPRLDLQHDDDGALRLRVRVARATTVEVMGTFTDWQPLSLEPRDDAWDVVVHAPAGSHRVLVRVNGGPWMPPANLPGIDDGFGGRVGLLVVP